MTISEAIISAAKIRLAENLEKSFRPGELREICGIAQGSFSPIFKGMRIDPGSAPTVNQRARGLFVQLQRGLYQLSEKGKKVVAEFGQNSTALPLEIQASQSLEEADYWSVTEKSDSRYRALVEVVQRRGQPDFRLRLISAYSSRCAISSCNAVPALEAAHISPYLGIHSNVTRNGLLLRADIHTLFDLGLIAIEPTTFTVRLSEKLMNTSYFPYHMSHVALPEKKEDSPDRDALNIRWLDFMKCEFQHSHE